MTPRTPVTGYRDLQADLHKAMKAYEDFDVDLDDPDSLANHQRLWGEAVKANEDFMAAWAKAPRRSAEVKVYTP